MLRCLKWLPLACLLFFAAFLGLGWVIGKPPTPLVPPREKPKMTLIFLAYDVSGQSVDAQAYASDGTLISKWTREVPDHQFIQVKPKDSHRYQERTLEVQWRTREQFLQWLDNGFQEELQARGADIPKWQSTLKQLRSDAADTSCNFPVILETR